MEGEPVDHGVFRKAISDFQAKLARDSSPDNILAVTSAVVQSLQHYNLNVSASLRAQRAEFAANGSHAFPYHG